jgi:hypothetical protein
MSLQKECKVLKRFREYFLGKKEIKMYRCDKCQNIVTEMMIWKYHACLCGCRGVHGFESLTKMESWRLGWRILIKGY